jgi:NTP pyrophosphatase (non-canonical NTP hydrolase)
MVEDLIEQWIEKHHNNDPSGVLFKLVEEVGELAGAYVKDKPKAERAGEAADALICLMMFAQAQGIDLLGEAHAKMRVNLAREGRVNRHGVFVKAADL